MAPSVSQRLRNLEMGISKMHYTRSVAVSNNSTLNLCVVQRTLTLNYTNPPAKKTDRQCIKIQYFQLKIKLHKQGRNE